MGFWGFCRASRDSSFLLVLNEGFQILGRETVSFSLLGADVDEAEPTGLNMLHQRLLAHVELSSGVFGCHQWACWKYRHHAASRWATSARSKMAMISPFILR